MIGTLETDPMVLKTLGAGNIHPFYWASFLAYRLGRCDVVLFSELSATTTPAYINYGRWVVDCPYCGAALPASKNVRAFWCPECGLEPLHGYGVRVRFPPDSTMRIIETILCMRPLARNRNWRPNESLAQLARENLDHGCTKLLEVV